jgi:hypothetical protein
MRDPVELCVEAASGWHGSWLDALGLRWLRRDRTWRALDRPPHIYFAGIALEPGVAAAKIASVPGSICDSWQSLDLEAHGFRVWRTEPWFHRPPGPLDDEPVPPELELVQVSTAAEVYEFEAVSVRGFGSEDDSIEPGTFHPPTVLADERMHMFLGRVDGRAVAAAMGYRSENVVGVFGVTTIASARRRGYGSAITRAAMLVDTALPSILAPSQMGERLYRRLGFDRVGELSIWSTEGPAP